MDQQISPKGSVIKTIYFYLVTFVGLMMVVFSSANLINTALKTWVFTKADNDVYYDMACAPQPEGKTVSEYSPAQCEKQREANRINAEANRVAQKQRDLVRDISFIAVGIPLFLFHWRFIRKKLDA